MVVRLQVYDFGPAYHAIAAACVSGTTCLLHVHRGRTTDTSCFYKDARAQHPDCAFLYFPLWRNEKVNLAFMRRDSCLSLERLVLWYVECTAH